MFEFFTGEQAAEALGITVSLVEHEKRQGRLRSQWLDGCEYYAASDLIQFHVEHVGGYGRVACAV